MPSLVASIEPAPALFGIIFFVTGVILTYAMLKWPGAKGGGPWPMRWIIPDVRPTLAVAFGGMFCLLGVGMFLFSLTDPVMLPPK